MPDDVEIMALTPPLEELPQEFQSRSLRRRALQAIGLLAVLVAVFLFAPGLSDVRDLLVMASPGWLVLAVLVVPHRPAVLAAKMLSTIDVLSEGRLVIGIGAGWLKAEFDAVV